MTRSSGSVPPIWLLVASFCACAASEEAKSPPIFGGEGAVIAKEQPLPPASAGEAPNAGPCGAAAPPGEVVMLEDFEDGDNRLFNAFQREGWWWSANDPTPDTKLLPPVGAFAPERLPDGEATPQNLFAAHLAAEGQKDWGAVWGTTLQHAREGIRCPFNASAFTGVSLRARGKGPVRITFGQPETLAGDGGGTCKKGCWDSYGKLLFLTEAWQTFELPWSSLQQEGWGTTVRFDPARLIQVGFKADVKHLPVDFWVDDLVFMAKPAGAG